MLAVDDPRHGTANAYNNLGCRCDACRAAGSAYQAEYRRTHRVASKCQREGCSNPKAPGPGRRYCAEHSVKPSPRPRRVAQSFHRQDAEGTWYVYRLFDSEGQLLYVGCSDQPWRRVSGHSHRSWGDRIATVTREAYASRLDALDAEAAAILAEQPAFNVNGKTGGRRAEHGSRLNVVIATLAARGPMTQGECAQAIDTTDGSDPRSFVGAILNRLLRDGRVVVVEERAGFGPWASTRVYGLPGQEVAA